MKTSEMTKDALLSVISNVVEVAKLTGVSTPEGSKTIRSAGNALLNKILSSVMTDKEKADEINSTMLDDLGLILARTTTIREDLTLQHLVRVFYVKRAKLMELIGNIVSN